MQIQNLSFLFLLIFFSCTGNKQETAQNHGAASIVFESNLYDFGTIPYNDDGRCYFEFTNNSNTPLIINTVRTSCGCTRPEWPEKPVKPGEKGQIGVSYNTKIPGNFRKSITVYSNAAESPAKLFIKGIVEPEEDLKP